MNSYPHMCRSDHEEIGHSDSEHEQCPMCRLLAEVEQRGELIRKLQTRLARRKRQWKKRVGC